MSKDFRDFVLRGSLDVEASGELEEKRGMIRRGGSLRQGRSMRKPFRNAGISALRTLNRTDKVLYRRNGNFDRDMRTVDRLNRRFDKQQARFERISKVRRYLIRRSNR